MDEASRLAWEDYRRRIRRYLAVTLGGFATAALLGIVSAMFDHWDIMSLVLPLAPIWLVLNFIVWCQVWFFSCPRCHNRFHSSYSWGRSCPHCGLRRGESVDAPAPLGWHNPGKFEWPERTKAPSEPAKP